MAALLIHSVSLQHILSRKEKLIMFEKLFKLKEHKTTVKTEVMAGITTFMTMAYILAVNPSILGDAGMDTTAVLLATALASFIGTSAMALMANLPFALSAGMGLNAFLAYTVVLGMGYSWQVALLAVFVEGIIFVVLSLIGRFFHRSFDGSGNAEVDDDAEFAAFIIGEIIAVIGVVLLAQTANREQRGDNGLSGNGNFRQDDFVKLLLDRLVTGNTDGGRGVVAFAGSLLIEDRFDP
jgi:hypothetical protein